MALAFERRPALRRDINRLRVTSIHIERWLAHCAITGAFGFVAGTLMFL
jgi:hypothetical protein